MMILEHGDMGCGIAMMFHMPARGHSTKPDPWATKTEWETTKEYKERFLDSTLKQRRMFTTHANQTMMSDDFSGNGTMKDGTKVLHLRTARDWLFEYRNRTATLITLGQQQNNNDKLGEVLLDVGFTLISEHPNPIMSWQPVYTYLFPAVTKEEYAKLSVSWSKKLAEERKAYESIGAATSAVRPSMYKHEGF